MSSSNSELELIDDAAAQTRGQKAHLTIAAAVNKVEAAEGARSVLLFEHGSLRIKMYAPRGHDPQTPHTQDEIYVVAQGSGVFFDGTARRNFQVGDLLFAPAGSTHRFENFSEDFAVWVVFYGPEGGETMN